MTTAIRSMFNDDDDDDNNCQNDEVVEDSFFKNLSASILEHILVDIRYSASRQETNVTPCSPVTTDLY
jgi:hypothetical protein